jgi:hypothetical protein
MTRRSPAVLGVLLALLLALVVLPSPAAAQTAGTTAPTGAGEAARTVPTTTVPSPLTTVVRAGSTDPNGVENPASETEPPAGHRLTARQARAIALADPKARAVLRDNRGSYHRIFLKGQTRWQLSIYAKEKPLREIGQVLIDDASGKVTESWDSHYVAWTMARGYDGAFGRSITSPWLWGVLLLLFLAPLVRLRPLRGPPIAILLLAGFTVPLAFFNNARLDWAVPLSFLLLLGLLAWGTVRGVRRPRSAPKPMRVLIPVSGLIVMGFALLVFRAILNVEDGNVIDVGYASVVGADKIGHGLSVYTPFPDNVGRGDTYGPLTYLAYVPFEQVWPWSGKWDDLPAAHAAAIALDALAALTLFFVGRRQEEDKDAGNRRGVLYAYLWLACPFTAYCLNSNSNDALPAIALGLVLLVGARPFARGMAAGAAGAAKIAPFAILPILATRRRVAPTVPVHHAPPAFWPVGRGDGPEGTPGRQFWRGALSGVTVLAGALVLVVVVSFVAMHWSLDPGRLYDRTIGYQAGRPAPFMPWGYYPDLGQFRDAARYAAILFAVVIAFVPRRHDVTGTAALVLAVIVGLQMATEYWFYLYLVWLIPLIVAGSLGDRPLRWHGDDAARSRGVVPRMHGPLPEEDAPWAADVRRRERERQRVSAAELPR